MEPGFSMLVALYIVIAIAALFLAGVWFVRTVWFHRDPSHALDRDDKAIRSPVYGRVSYIRRVFDGMVISEKLGEVISISDITKEDWPISPPPAPSPLAGTDQPKGGEGEPSGDGWLIGIAMTPLDVHFQYAPIAGRMGTITHHGHGRNLPMFDFWEYVRITWLRKHVQLWAREYVFENERQTMWIEGGQIKVALILIADKFVSKISTFVNAGDEVPAGGKLSFIARGSQVDLLICGYPEMPILVKEGDAAAGPNTVIARLPSH